MQTNQNQTQLQPNLSSDGRADAKLKKETSKLLWHPPTLTRLSLSLDTAATSGSGADGFGRTGP